MHVNITCRNNASISNFSGGFRWQCEYPWCIIDVKKKQKKKSDGVEHFYMILTQKLITLLVDN
ncbi:Uncharacterized protein FWK35_00026727 [Aphis craccivora]|uniref:Uncharacterized protein n=1 Tax=Aphis craccivora TaxID=307492 RepID=A0A6G0YLV2_APHCR|nr:Uncharacterized protein FWK35_00026727 [Aphis craccivora]